MQTTFSDIRHAVGMFWKAPGFSLAAVLTLALGIGVNVAVFSLLHAALLASLPVREPHRLVQIASWTGTGGDHFDFSYPLYVDLRDRGEGLSGLAAYVTGTVGIAAGDRSERILAEFVTSNYFPLLGVQISMGPGLTGADELRGGPRVAVISDALWHRMFNRDAGIIGRTVALNGQTFAIVGVTPRGFEGIVRGQRADLWASVSQFFPLRNRPDLLDERTSSWMSLIGRLAPGVTAAQAQDRFTTALRQLDVNTVADDYSARLHNASSGDRGLVEGLDTPLRLLMATVGLILVIACANVANLLLARAHARQQELAVRQALGATRGRIVRQLLAETLVLSLAGGFVGLLCAFWIVDMFELRTAGSAAALALPVGAGWPVVMFAATVSVLTALGAGLVPAWGTSRTDLVEVIKRAGGALGGTPGRSRARSVLAIVQIALSLVLIVGAGLFLRSLARLRSIDASLSTDRVIAATINLTLRGYNEARGRQFYEALLSRVSAEPGIQAATLTSVLPVTAGGSRVNVNARTTQPPLDVPFEADMISVSPGYFRTFSVPLVSGRDFEVSDRAGSRFVTVINETMKDKVWGRGDPVGQTFSLGPQDTYLVVGVARDTKYRNLREAPRMTMYLPLAQSYGQSANLVVRTALSTDDTVRALRRQVAAVDAAMPLYNVRTLAEHVERSLYLDAMRARLIATLAMLAASLSAVGVYGLVSYTVAERTREVGLRLALGARPSEVVRLVLATGARLAAAGIGLGLVLALWVTRSVATQLYGIRPGDPLTLAGACAFLFAVVLTATLIPALRVTRVDPMTALREGSMG
jgi:putative ABC transport system permease protein